MRRLLRLKHLLLLMGLVALGLLPVYAIHPNVGGNIDDFTVAAGRNVTVSTGGQAFVNGAGFGGVPGSPGRTGAVSNISAGITSQPGGNFVGGIVPAVISELGALKSGLSALTPNFSFGGTVDLRTLDIDGGGPIPPGTLVPGVYSFVNVTISDGGGSPDITFNGSGEYILNISGTFTTDNNVQVAGVGANPADVFFNVGNVVNIGANNALAGIILAETSVTIADGTVIFGKVFARLTDVTFVDDGVGPFPTINDFGFPPNVLVNGQPVPQAGLNLTVCVGQTLNYTVTATDPEGQAVTITRTSPAGATQGFAGAGTAAGTPTATLNESFTPSAMQGGTTLVATYRAQDASLAVTDFQVNIQISNPPVISPAQNIAGNAPFNFPPPPPGNLGDQATPIVACVGTTLTFDVTATDPDSANTNVVTLTGSTNAAGATIVPNPAVGTGSATAQVTFTPTPGQGGGTFTFTFNATDNAGCAAAPRTIFVFVSSLPVFDTPPTPPDLSVLTACVGEILQFDVQGSDPDPGDTVQLSVAGVPDGANHDPNFLGNDNFGPFGDDILANSATDPPGNPVDTRFEWTPTSVDVGAYPLTYTLQDSFGCITQRQVLILVTNRPAFNTPPTPAEGTVLHVCPGQLLSFPVSATDPDGDTVQLTTTGQPAGFALAPTLGAGTVNATATFTPTAGQAGQTFTVVITATDITNTPTFPSCTPNATRTVIIDVANVPTFTAPTPGVGTPSTLNVCEGNTLNFRVRATDADAGDSVTLTQTGAPAGMVFTPTLPTAGNPVETVVTFTPTAGSPRQSVITFTATDSTGCTATQVVTVNVSANPVITISNVTGRAPNRPGSGTSGDPFVVCVGTAFGFTVTATDSDVASLVTLTQTGAPGNSTFTPTLPRTGNPVSSNFAFTPTANQGGQTFQITFTATDNSGAACQDVETIFIRVSSLPVITATPNNITVCDSDPNPVAFRVRATDTDAGNVTLTATNVPAGMTFTPSLPTAGNPVETVASFDVPDVAADTTFNVTFTATDADGCTAQTVVTITVQNARPTTITLTREGTLAVGSEICFTATVLDQCGFPSPGQPVLFIVDGDTGNNQTTTVLTDANGRARLCFTPLFPGDVTVTVCVDANGNSICDVGEISDSETVTIPGPATTTGGDITGTGVVDTAFGSGVPVPGVFAMNIQIKRNGTPRGTVNFTVPAAGSNGVFRSRSTRITSATITESNDGLSGLIFGTANTTAFGRVRFRVDTLDAGTPGVPNDRFVITFLLNDGTVIGPLGGNLVDRRSRGLPRTNDVRIRVGFPVP